MEFFFWGRFFVVLFNFEGWIWGSSRFVCLFICFQQGDRIWLGLLKCLIIRCLIHHHDSLKYAPVELTSGAVRCVEICSNLWHKCPPGLPPRARTMMECHWQDVLLPQGGQQWTKIVTAFFDPMSKCIFGCWDLAYGSNFSSRDMRRRIHSPWSIHLAREAKYLNRSTTLSTLV